MDALASSNQSGFLHLISHISLYHTNMSAGFANFTRHVLVNDVKLRNVEATNTDSKSKFKLWDVPGMGTQLGKVMPFDIYGQHVLIDEKEMQSPGKKVTHGVLRYAIAAAGVRRKEGGRRVYDYATMNFALAAGAIVGGAFVFHSRRRFSFLERRPALSICLGLGICAAAIPVVRSLFKIFAVGLTIAERQHAKALRVTECYDCLCDIYEFTEDQIADVKLARLPPPKPGLPPITPEQEKAFAAAMEMQALVLGRDLSTIRSILKQMLSKNDMLLLQPKAVDPTASLTTADAAAESSGGEGKIALRSKASKAALKAEHETTLTSSEEAALLINARSVPGSMLCEVHRGLRLNPDGYEHPDKYPIFPLDRQMAKSRPKMIA